MGTIGKHGGIVSMVIKAISEPCTCTHIVVVKCTFHIRVHVQKILWLRNVHVFMYMFPIMVMMVHLGRVHVYSLNY